MFEDRQHESRCLSCGAPVTEKQYQMRAADEAHTSVWSCGMCPLDASRVSILSPPEPTEESYPRHRRARPSLGMSSGAKRVGVPLHYLEVCLESTDGLAGLGEYVANNRSLCSLKTDDGTLPCTGYSHSVGPHALAIIRVESRETLSPICCIQSVSRYSCRPKAVFTTDERDGEVCEIKVDSRTAGYAYRRTVGKDVVCSAVIPLRSKAYDDVKVGVQMLCTIGVSWPSAFSFVSRNYMSLVNNLSPRAWDSKRAQKRGAVYSPKVDGERVYVMVFEGMVHVFAKTKARPHLGLAVLETRRAPGAPVVIDAENTVSHGVFFIDMLTDSHGTPSPRSRDYQWSLEQFEEITRATGMLLVRVKPHVSSLAEAESISENAAYPTDGVVCLWPGTTTARKMKVERSVELEVTENAALVTSDGDTVFSNIHIPKGILVGHIVEVRLRLRDQGRGVAARPVFRRVDKTAANSTSAVSAVLSSFSGVVKDNESKRREVLIWCDSLRHHLFKLALKSRGSKKIVIDVGTGTGQSLDVLSPDRGVSYVLVEPSRERCEMLRKRAGTHKVVTDPKELMYSMRLLKSGVNTYLVANMTLESIVSDEEVMSFICDEIAFVCATFSAHFVVPQLYDLCKYWNVPMVGCVYPYENVVVGGFLVNSLDVTMERSSENLCSVKWGGDEKYIEPFTTTQHYSSFCSIARAVDMVPPPSEELNPEAYSMCEKVYVLHELR